LTPSPSFNDLAVVAGDEADRPSIEEVPHVPGEVAAPPLWVPTAVVASTANALTRIHGDGTSSLGITSALRGEGRTTIAMAAAVAERYDYGRKTILVDLDFGRASIGERTGDALSPGLAEYLRGTAELDECIRWHDRLLGVLPAGAVGEDIDLLTSAILRSWALKQIGLLADVVVADLPPLPPVGGGARLLGTFNTVLLVVRAGFTTTESVRTAMRSFDTPPPVLLNRVGRHAPRR
jgi:Mrp family chromosome partitioning ATPase